MKRQREPRPSQAAKTSGAIGVVRLEPALLRARDAAAFLGCSVRLFDEFVRAGDVQAIKIPDRRRVVYAVANLRALADRWAKSDSGRGG